MVPLLLPVCHLWAAVRPGVTFKIADLFPYRCFTILVYVLTALLASANAIEGTNINVEAQGS